MRRCITAEPNPPSRSRWSESGGFRLVGEGGFEPPAPCPQSRCASRTALLPVNRLGGYLRGSAQPKR